MNNIQKYWSYFFRIVVEKQSSTYNSELIVAIQDGRYVLNTKNANYSFASLHRVFRQIFQKIEISNKNIESVLVLGCGAGSIPTIIYKELKLNFVIDAVEIDTKVIDLANKYFGLNDFVKLNIIINDAADFVKKTDKKYDLIIVDLFNDINVPLEFLTQDFFKQLKSLLNDEGELLFNFVAYNYEKQQQVIEMKQILNQLFINKCKVYSLESINRVFYCKK